MHLSLHPAEGPRPIVLLVGLVVVLLAGCGAERAPTLFERLPASETGLAFENTLTEDTTFSILNYLYYYNGGGVAAGDVNGDGLLDLYFTANEQPNRLYLNRGGFRFEDVTEAAGVAGSSNWTTGATLADVNGDGHLDLYVAAVGGYLGRTGRNELFINDGTGHFTEQAAAYGLAFSGYGTHAAFFDYDRDGDLDVYLLNHSTHWEDTYERVSVRAERHPRAGDRLYRNDADSLGQGRRFVDVSEAAGIFGGRTGYGLSVAVSDLDGDGCPDLYVANDFHEDDYLYWNNCDGTFTEGLRAAVGHTSQAAMGTDAADLDNDGRPDIVVLDMMPENETIRQTSASVDSRLVAEEKLAHGYYYQYPRNTLQHNRGRRRFSEIGYLAGVEATDWSWAPLLADFDNDGLMDLFITNGIYRRPNDLDYIGVASQDQVQVSLTLGVTQEDLALLDLMPHVPLANVAFRNEGDLRFKNEAAAWGLDQPGFSNGAAYADLDNDGDLDLVVNNINAPASVYENRSDSLLGHHALTVTLVGSGANTAGIGATVLLWQGGALQMREAFPTRGFQSSVDPRLHFGLGTAATVDSLTVIWPDGRYQTLENVPADQILTLRQDESRGAYDFGPRRQVDPLFEDVTDALAPDYRHEENLSFDDFVREPLMPHRLSAEGPALAVGDVNGDGLDDLFAGGAKWQPARLFLQQRDGRFAPTDAAPWQADGTPEDVDAAFFDADGDGDLDLYVVSSGNEFWAEAEALKDRLYLNDGAGRFSRADNALPDFFENGCCVRPADFDGDGDVDLFVGSRVVSRYYGVTPRSYLLENDGAGVFRDVTEARADGLAEVGLVTDAAWTDYDGDGHLDLVVVGEWMPLRVFAQQEGRFVERTAQAGLAETSGWWHSVRADDFDGDGDADLIAGNLGLNSAVRAQPDEPARLYLKDFDEDGRLDPLLTTYRNGVSYPLATSEMLLGHLPFLRERFSSFNDFGARRIEDLIPAAQLAEAEVLEARTFASTFARNNGDGTFTLRPLPTEAQLAPAYALLTDDFDRDGHRDVLLAGNFFGVEPLRGRYDAGYGALLRGDGAVGFEPMEPAQSDLWLGGEVRAVRLLRGADGSRLLVVARNNEGLQLLRLRRRDDVLARRDDG